jgi:hypothetical protein
MKSVHSDEPMEKFETDPITIDENDEMIQPHQIKVELELEQGKITFFWLLPSLFAINHPNIL